MISDRSKKHIYDESKIKTLSSLEHIRTRTGMYIGRTGDGTHYDDGIYVLLKEVIDNCIDEFIMGYGKRIEVILEDDTVNVRDYGRGIPLGKLVECVSRINTGAKYNDDVFQFSVGLNGVGTKAVNALSSYFVARSHRGEKFVEARFAYGVLETEDKGTNRTEKDGTFISFSPDSKIFKNFAFREDHIDRRLRFYSYLNAGLIIVFNGHKVVSKGGLLDLIRDENELEKVYPPFHYRDKKLEFAFTHTHRFSEDYYSFVNGQFTNDGGSHLSAFREGLLKGINEYANGKFSGDDVREGVLGAVSIRLKEPVFESQTKNKLGNTEIRSDLVANVKKAVVEQLHRNKPAAEKLLEKVKESQRLRKELNSVKKLARERSKAVSIRVPQLKDCKKHFNKRKDINRESMVFITEGQSAAGSVVSCRDVNFQAIYTLKGKPLNVWDLQRGALYKNVEIYNLMRSLNIEDTIDGLRYNHIILATDADVDGLHIRNLMITFFLRFFEPIVRDGHLQILETPLFRVRNKKQTFYCYTETERDTACEKLGRAAEITRFKGLGEISPCEFKSFIGKQMKLTSISMDEDCAIPDLLTFYMGKNTQERRSYIMNHLVVDEEIL